MSNANKRLSVLFKDRFFRELLMPSASPNSTLIANWLSVSIFFFFGRKNLRFVVAYNKLLAAFRLTSLQFGSERCLAIF